MSFKFGRIRTKAYEQNKGWVFCNEYKDLGLNGQDKPSLDNIDLVISFNKWILIGYFKRTTNLPTKGYFRIKNDNTKIRSIIESYKPFFCELINEELIEVEIEEEFDENILKLLEIAEEEILNEEFLFNNENNITKDYDIIKKYENTSPKNIILYGPPGTGKTFSFKKLISIIEDDLSLDLLKEDYSTDKFNLVEEENRFKFITFHQSYSYEDFIEGFRPTLDDSNNDKVKIKLQDGLFKEICESASKIPNKSFYLIIDEINRGNISKIFGELITLLEEDKRDKLSVLLPYSKEIFTIPKNLFIIGTMNTADKSIALLDVALRRRFIFVEMYPNLDLIKDTTSRDIIRKINKIIVDNRTKDLQIGHAYFMQEKEKEFVFKYQIKPLLEEYFYGENLKEVFNNDTEVLDILGIN